jgi:hypothetical protein
VFDGQAARGLTRQGADDNLPGNEKNNGVARCRRAQKDVIAADEIIVV